VRIHKETINKLPLGTLKILAIALLLITLLTLTLSKEPGAALSAIFFGSFSNSYSFGNFINSSVPIILCGLGILIALKANLMNLGGEGQVYFSAFIVTMTSLSLEKLGLFGAIIGLLAGGIAGGAIAGFSAFLFNKWKTNVMITTYLVSAFFVSITDYLITNTFHNPATNLLSTKQIPSSQWLHTILAPSALNTSLIYAIFACFVIRYFLYKTLTGYEMRMVGSNIQFARYGGIHNRSITIKALFLSGFFHGLAGGFIVLGTYHAALRGFTGGIGWSGLSVALIAGGSPLATIPASLFFAWLQSGATIAMQQSDVTSELAEIAQGAVFLLITSNVLLKGRNKNV